MSRPNVEFKDNRISVKKGLGQKALIWIEEILAELESQTIRNTRTDTGNTKRNWKHFIDENICEGYLGNVLENALWEELGTGEYAINGDGRKGAWYVPIEWVTGHNKPTYYGKVTVVYNKEGKAFYKTNGKKPTRAMTKAFESKKNWAKKRAEEIFGDE